MKAQIQDNGETSEPFPVSSGVKQGCVLAPTLFSLMFSAMLTDAFRDGDVGIDLRYRTDGKLFNLRRLHAKTKVKRDIIGDFLFADDCALIAGSEADMQRSVDKFSIACTNLHTTCLRKLLNIKWQDWIPDTEVLAQEDLPSTYAILMQSQLCWAGHVARMPYHRLPKRLFYGELQQGKRSHEGQKKRFKDTLKHP